MCHMGFVTPRPISEVAQQQQLGILFISMEKLNVSIRMTPFFHSPLSKQQTFQTSWQIKCTPEKKEQTLTVVSRVCFFFLNTDK